ncbi:hypothetical protein [Methylibium petroleiphilum]
MSTELIARLTAEAGFNVKRSVIDGSPWIDQRAPFAGGHVIAGTGYQPPALMDHMAKLCALVAEECARQTERSTCADQAAAHIRALFPPAP